MKYAFMPVSPLGFGHGCRVHARVNSVANTTRLTCTRVENPMSLQHTRAPPPERPSSVSAGGNRIMTWTRDIGAVIGNLTRGGGGGRSGEHRVLITSSSEDDTDADEGEVRGAELRQSIFTLLPACLGVTAIVTLITLAALGLL